MNTIPIAALPFFSETIFQTPAAGSYFIENLTVSIAKQAWDLFLNVEEEGGMLEAVKAGKVQEAVKASNKARHDAVSKRKEDINCDCQPSSKKNDGN